MSTSIGAHARCNRWAEHECSDSGCAGADAGLTEGQSTESERYSPVAAALAYGESLVGTPYGWWTGGPLPKGEPMYTASGPAPNAAICAR